MARRKHSPTDSDAGSPAPLSARTSTRASDRSPASVAASTPAKASDAAAVSALGAAQAAPPDDGLWDGSVPPAATAVVKRLEGFFAQPYDDNGAQPGGTWTIGYGSIIDARGHRVTPQTAPITEAEAEQLLRRDMAGAARDVQLRVQVPLRSCEAAALISWVYNLGAGNLAKSTLLLRLNANRKSEVPTEMRRWIMHEGRPVLGLLRRRWAEAAIFAGMDATQACVRAWRDIDDLSDWPPF